MFLVCKRVLTRMPGFFAIFTNTLSSLFTICIRRFRKPSTVQSADGSTSVMYRSSPRHAIDKGSYGDTFSNERAISASLCKLFICNTLS